MSLFKECADLIQSRIDHLVMSEFGLQGTDKPSQKDEEDKIRHIIDETTANSSPEFKIRMQEEFLGDGPLSSLVEDPSITEIIVNGFQHLWFEKNGRLFKHTDAFTSKLTYNNFIERICSESRLQITIDHPIADGKWRDFRLNISGPYLTREGTVLCLRRHPKTSWTLDQLLSVGWCEEHQVMLIKKLVINKANILVVGPTGSGKTSILSSCLQLLSQEERVVIIEDSDELKVPNQASTKLLTREDPFDLLKKIDASFLVKQSLRMRPDRLVMGEIRGSEAKDFLMALSTGHSGSMGTLHASHPRQALIRLEMLIQMGAPHWSLIAIRQLIHLSLKYILMTGKNQQGQRTLQGLYEISSLEENGFLVERLL